MKLNIEKVISFLYLVCIVWVIGLFSATSFVLLYKIFSGSYLFGIDSIFSILDNVTFVFFAIPLFLIFKIIFWRKNKKYLNKENINKTSKLLKRISYLIVLAFVLMFLIYINFSNPSFSSNYNFDLANSFWFILRDFANLIIFPLIFIFFAFNFLKDKDVDRRNRNLFDLIWTMTFSLLIVNFTKLIAFIIYDCEIVIYHLIKI
jgi:hypothetical protein